MAGTRLDTPGHDDRADARDTPWNARGLVEAPMFASRPAMTIRVNAGSGPWAAFALLATACTPPAALKPDPHYVLGAPYQVGPVWLYPLQVL